MDDILTVLEQQTAQTESLINRLSERLALTQQLRDLEQSRRQLAATIAGLEERLTGLDADLTQLRQLTVETPDDANSVQQAAQRLDSAWTGIAGRAGLLSPTVPAIHVAPPAAPVRQAEAGVTPDHFDDELAGLETGIGQAEDALDVLGSFFGGGGETDWLGGGGSSFFSAAEELGADDADSGEDWWLSGSSAEAPGPATATDMFALNAAEPAPPPPVPTASGKNERRGLLGRFF